ncbi:hypothetical protein ACFLVR_04375 [Chloroflexota bacterium]
MDITDKLQARSRNASSPWAWLRMLAGALPLVYMIAIIFYRLRHGGAVASDRARPGKFSLK